MFDLRFASINVRKAAAIRGIRNGLYRPISDYKTVAVVTDDNGEKETEITQGNAEYASQFTWREIKKQF